MAAPLYSVVFFQASFFFFLSFLVCVDVKLTWTRVLFHKLMQAAYQHMDQKSMSESEGPVCSNLPH